MTHISPPAGSVDVATIAETSHAFGPNFEVVAPGSVSGTVLRGNYRCGPLRRGLLLHSSDAIDVVDLVTRVEQFPGLSLLVFLKGRPDASVGGRPILPEGAVGGARALLTARTRPEIFERRGHKGDHMRKISITVSHDWLADSGFDLGGGAGGGDGMALERFSRRHLAQHAWSPGPRLVALAERLLRAPDPDDPFRALREESQALELLAEAFATLTAAPSADAPGRLDPRDLRRLRRVTDFLEEDGARTLTSLEDIARHAGVSVSTLQRLFQAAHGMSAFEYIRRRNLERARVALERDGVPVKEAAFLAGYSSAANFATAFRKMFGHTPRQARAS